MPPYVSGQANRLNEDPRTSKDPALLQHDPAQATLSWPLCITIPPFVGHSIFWVPSSHKSLILHLNLQHQGAPIPCIPYEDDLLAPYRECMGQLQPRTGCGPGAFFFPFMGHLALYVPFGCLKQKAGKCPSTGKLCVHDE